MRLRKRPVPTWLTQRSNCPSRSARNATNFPSGEISAPASVPSQSVKRENCALASGFSWMIAGRRASHTPTAAASDGERDPRQPRRAGLRRGTRRRRHVGTSRQHLVDRVDLDPDVADVSQALLRILGEAAEQEPSNRRAGVAAGSADQSGSRSRIFAIVSETVSPGNARRPVSIS